ncbi:alpha/beta fold hydrolase [Candidatus Finniella inopinata]|uniref:Alpha/beta hydrolase n=1 Tax=Candidatus Finniella inopinata TaxID=1696036 RepID=A0A4Q7DL52_9PROT|nr:alpha/beta hydrolase [Candidatus Finniella inopinata]RZI47130.1 alpha/beta hydrolase [Candidatus Finniella inopinata]
MLKIFRQFALLLIFLSPLHAEFSYQSLKHENGVKIRVGEWHSKVSADTKKLLIICPGRASFIEKNDRLADYFANLGFRVVVIDWRGHGGSDRETDNPQKVYIDDYQSYVEDVKLTLKTYRTSDQAIYLVGSSMGSLVVLHFLSDQSVAKTFPVQAAVFLSPMLGLKTNPFPVFAARWLSAAATKLGYADHYCFGYGDFDINKDVFEKNRGTHDRENFERQKKITQDHPQFMTAGPTYGWLNASFRALDQALQAEGLQAITTPIFIATAGDDQTVDTSQDAKVASHLKIGTHKIYEGAWHNIFNETADIHQKLTKDIEAFLTTHSTNH